MSGRWLLDAAALWGASRRVLWKHVALRNNQFRDYQETSSLARAIKNQTDRVTRTIRAASTLAEHSDEQSQKYSAAPKTRDTKDKTAIPSEKSVDRGGREAKPLQEVLEQDHFYIRSKANTTDQPVASSSIDVQQEQAKGISLPDGTITTADVSQAQSNSRNDVFSKPSRSAPAKEPLLADGEHPVLRPKASERSSIPDPAGSTNGLPASEGRRLQRQAEAQIPSQVAEPPSSPSLNADRITSDEPEVFVDRNRDVYYTPTSNSSPVLSSFPHVEIPKNAKDTQAGNEHVPDTGINQDVYYSSKPDGEAQLGPQVQAEPEQDPVSDQMLSEIFHSPKVAKLLTGKQGGLDNSMALHLLGPDSALRKETNASDEGDNDSLNSRSGSEGRTRVDSESKVTPGSSTEVNIRNVDVHELASDIAKDAEASATEGERVRDCCNYSHGLDTDN